MRPGRGGRVASHPISAHPVPAGQSTGKGGKWRQEAVGCRNNRAPQSLVSQPPWGPSLPVPFLHSELHPEVSSVAVEGSPLGSASHSAPRELTLGSPGLGGARALQPAVLEPCVRFQRHLVDASGTRGVATAWVPVRVEPHRSKLQP